MGLLELATGREVSPPRAGWSFISASNGAGSADSGCGKVGGKAAEIERMPTGIYVTPGTGIYVTRIRESRSRKTGICVTPRWPVFRSGRRKREQEIRSRRRRAPSRHALRAAATRGAPRPGAGWGVEVGQARLRRPPNSWRRLALRDLVGDRSSEAGERSQGASARQWEVQRCISKVCTLRLGRSNSRRPCGRFSSMRRKGRWGSP